jgi:hypothetical protein
MSPRSLAFVGCRLLALFVLVSSLQAIVFNTWFLLQSFRSQEQWSSQDKVLEGAIYSVPIVALLIMVAILWWRADWIAGRVVTRPAEAAVKIGGGWSPQDALSVAVIALGLWVLIDHLPALVSYLFLLINDIHPEGAEAFTFALVNVQGLVSTLFTTGLGLLCIFGSQTVAEFIGRLRRW